MNVGGLIAEVDALRLVDSDDQPILIDFLHCLGLGYIDFDAGLENGRGDHKDDEEHENHVDEGDHVDLGERGLRRYGELRHIFRFYQGGRVGTTAKI